MAKRFPYCFIAPSLFWIAGILLENNDCETVIPILILLGAILFPLLTAGFKRNKLDLLKYLILSNLIFYLVSFSYWYNDRSNHLILLGAFLGSILFQQATKYIFKLKISWTAMLVLAILSVIAFIPFQMNWSYDKLGFAVFLWMMINSVPINYKKR